MPKPSLLQAPELLTYAEAADRLGITPDGVQRRVNRGTLPAVLLGYHRNGKPQYGIPAGALLQRPLSVRPASSDLAAGRPRDRLPLTRDGVPDVAAMRHIGLAAHAEEWERRMRLVHDVLAARLRGDRNRATMARIAERYGRRQRTAYQYLHTYIQGGPAALVPDWDPGRGRTALPVNLQLQIRETYLTSRRLSAAQVYHDVVLPHYRDMDENPPHISTLRRFLRDHIRPLEEIARCGGYQEWRQRAAPKVVRDLPPVGEVWSTDHRLWDVLVVVADGRGKGWGKHDRLKCTCGSARERRRCCSLRRPWVTSIFDVGSAALVGWRAGLVPTAAGVCHAVRSAVLRWGLPNWWCPDRGREFRARRLSRADAEAYDRAVQSSVWPLLGVEVHPALPYSAWSKPAESFFSALSRRWENYHPGWVGRDAKDKPEALDRQVRNGTLLTFAEFCTVFDGTQVPWWNEQHACGERSAPPADLYKDHARARARPDPQTLCFLLQDERQPKVQPRGITLSAGGETYRYYRPELALYVEMSVTVRWDPEEPAHVWCYTPDGSVLALQLAQNAAWGEWGEANRAARAGARLQRELLAERAREVTGATSPERLDPLGAVALIQERLEAVAQDAARRQAQLQAADEEARRQATALKEAEDKPKQKETTVYDQFLEGVA